MRSTARMVRDALAWLKRRGSKRNVLGMARYGIVSRHVLGVSVARVRELGKTLGRDHALALALWRTGVHEARMLAAFVDEPASVTPAQMNEWARDFDNWAICDTVCFHLFDKTPHAWARIGAWSTRREEFVKRAAFALLASVALHDKEAPDERFVRAIPLIVSAAVDDRNFVKKAVSWALRGVGRRNTRLRARALAVARRLATRPEASARWIGRDALRELAKPPARRRLSKATA